MTRSTGMLHWLSALVAAAAVLALAAPIITAAQPLLERAGVIKKKPRSAYQLSNSRKGKAVFSARNVVPGQVGRGTVVISNTGRRPFRKVTLSQTAVRNRIGTSAKLQVYDATTGRCIYPAPRRKLKRPPKRCTSWGWWTGKRKLRNAVVPPRRGKVWRPRERHVIHVRWRVGQDIPQGRKARFNLVWRGGR